MQGRTKYAAITVLIAFTVILFFQTVSSKVQLPPAGNNGNPTTSPPGQTCAQCHSGSSLLNAGSKAEIKIGETNPDSSLSGFNYELNKSYKISFTANAVGKRFGFQLSALTSANQNAGVFSLSNTSNTSKLSVPITYVGHKDATGNNTWSFNWNSPITNVGDIIFYYTFVAADSNDDSTNDTVYKGTTTIHALTTGIEQAEVVKNLSVYPNPVKDVMNVSFDSEKAEEAEIKLFSLEGKLVKNLALEGSIMHFNSCYNLEQLHAGIYLLQIKVGDKITCRKIIVE